MIEKSYLYYQQDPEAGDHQVETATVPQQEAIQGSSKPDHVERKGEQDPEQYFNALKINNTYCICTFKSLSNILRRFFFANV